MLLKQENNVKATDYCFVMQQNIDKARDYIQCNSILLKQQNTVLLMQ